MALTPGTRLGPYEVTAQIGVGGMGEVYRATDANLKRAVAIKVLPASLAGDAERLARFQREAEVLAALNHPNIAQIYGLEKSGGTVALVMELVEGPTLADLIAGAGAGARALSIEDALPIARQIADALEAAHEQGIIHRDLKPANIKVRADGVVKVLDFGLAKAMEPAGSKLQDPAYGLSQAPTITTPAMMTGVGMILGTAAYMSPEQARGKTVDRRTDIWAFACVLYEMLTGARAFGDEDVSLTLSRVLQREPDFVAFPPDVPARVRRVLELCLRKDPKLRAGDIRDVRLALEGAFETSGPPTAARVPAARSAGWRGVATLTAGALGVAVVTGTAVWFAARSASRTAETPAFPVRFTVSAPPQTVFTPQAVNNFGHIAVSPDGTQIAFTAGLPGQGQRLWVRSLDAIEARRFDAPTGVSFPFWSPDSRSIGFFAQGKLQRVDAVGGPPVVLADAPSGDGGAWSPGGVIVFNPDRLHGLFGVPAAGGPAEPLTGSSDSQRWPAFLPDGRRFLFLGPDGIHLGSIDSKDTRQLFSASSRAEYAPDGHVLFVRQTTLLAQPFDGSSAALIGEPIPLAQGLSVPNGRAAFSVSGNGVLVYRTGEVTKTHLRWFDRAGKAIGTLGEPDAYGQMALSPDGTQLAFERSNETLGFERDIWLMDVVRNVASRFTSDPADDSIPIWSSDGLRVIFRSNRTGVFDLYAKAIRGGDEEVFLKTPYDKFAEHASPDGRFVAYLESPADIWLVPQFGDRKPFRWLAPSAFVEDEPQFSPDGRWMAYNSNESGRHEVYLQPFERQGQRTRVSSAGGGQPRWRSDGRELFYLAPDGKMMAVDVRLGAVAEVGSPKALFETGIVASPVLDQYVVTADGQRFLVAVPESQLPTPLTVMLNWTAALKR